MRALVVDGDKCKLDEFLSAVSSIHDEAQTLEDLVVVYVEMNKIDQAKRVLQVSWKNGRLWFCTIIYIVDQLASHEHWSWAEVVLKDWREPARNIATRMTPKLC